MANLMDYIAWRGDFGFDVSPWNEVDALMMANLCYLNFQGVDDERGWSLADARRLELVQDTEVANFDGRLDQFLAMAESRRFGDIRMHHFIALTDVKQELQFSAVLYDMPDGTLCVGFRGTDGTLIGWREDFNMSYQSTVPAQEAAVFYLKKAAELDRRRIRIVGHSKGGNLAAYAAACCGPEVQDRIESVYSFDGPGMAPDIFGSEGYHRVVDRIRSFVPETSIVGMMMEYHRVYTVVKSDASGINQHDPLSWQVLGPRFETAEQIDSNAKMVSSTLHEWLAKTNPEERANMVRTLFGLLENTKATTVADIMGDRLRTLTSMAMASRELDPVSRKTVTKLVGLFLSLGFGNLTDKYLLNLKRKERTEEEKQDSAGDVPGIEESREPAEAEEEEKAEESAERESAENESAEGGRNGETEE